MKKFKVGIEIRGYYHLNDDYPPTIFGHTPVEVEAENENRAKYLAEQQVTASSSKYIRIAEAVEGQYYETPVAVSVEEVAADDEKWIDEKVQSLSGPMPVKTLHQSDDL